MIISGMQKQKAYEKLPMPQQIELPQPHTGSTEQTHSEVKTAWPLEVGKNWSRKYEGQT